MVLAQILLWTLVGSVFGLIGGVLLLFRKDFTAKYSILFVSFAAGAMLGAVFFDLLPEVLQGISENAGISAASVFLWSLLGILVFFVFERLLSIWHHHHPGAEKHAYTYNMMLGDTIHNFLDGVFIAAVFLTNPSFGPIAAIAVFLHEIPQEMGDFGALLHGGWSRRGTLMVNIMTALAAMVGAIGTFYVAPILDISVQLVALTIGAFLYIAVVDLMPISFEKRKNMMLNVAMILLGAALIWAAGMALPVSG